MAYELKEGQGSAFKNEKKQPTHADFAGSIKVDGKEYWLNVWVKEGQKGRFLSMSVKPKAESQNKPAPKYDTQDDPLGDAPF